MILTVISWMKSPTRAWLTEWCSTQPEATWVDAKRQIQTLYGETKTQQITAAFAKLHALHQTGSAVIYTATFLQVSPFTGAAQYDLIRRYKAGLKLEFQLAMGVHLKDEEKETLADVSGLACRLDWIMMEAQRLGRVGNHSNPPQFEQC